MTAFLRLLKKVVKNPKNQWMIITHTHIILCIGTHLLHRIIHTLHSLTHTHRVPPKMQCGCLHGGAIENGRTRNPLTLWTAPVRVWVHILGDPQCSVEECYNTYSHTQHTYCMLHSLHDEEVHLRGIPLYGVVLHQHTHTHTHSRYTYCSTACVMKRSTLQA